MRYFFILPCVNATAFFNSVQRQLACQYACSLIPECVAGEGSVCQEADAVCKGISRTTDGFCFNCDEDEKLTCDEAMQGFIASVIPGSIVDGVTETYTPPNYGSDEEDWVFGFIPDWLKPGK